MILVAGRCLKNQKSVETPIRRITLGHQRKHLNGNCDVCHQTGPVEHVAFACPKYRNEIVSEGEAGTRRH